MTPVGINGLPVTGKWHLTCASPPPVYFQAAKWRIACAVTVIRGASGKYHFNLVAANGQVIATSEAYERKQSALHGIERVKENAPGAEVDDQTGE
jgi:uncharacterized protein YegP (UPF0339 family)